MENFRKVALIGAIYNNFDRLFDILSLIRMRDKRDVNAIIAYGGIDARAYGDQLNRLSTYVEETLQIPFYLIPLGIDKVDNLINWFGVGKLHFMPTSSSSQKEHNFSGYKQQVTVYQPSVNIGGFKIGCSYKTLGKPDSIYGESNDDPNHLHLFVGKADDHVDVGNIPTVVSPSLSHKSSYVRYKETDFLKIVRLKKDYPEFFYYGCSVDNDTQHLWKVHIPVGYDGWCCKKIERLDARPEFNVTKVVYHNIHLPSSSHKKD